MGLQASAALLLKSLVEKDDSWLHREANELISRFSLFAIILADPVKDPGFYDYVQNNFSRFDQMTGSNFLFFSIIKDARLNVIHGTRSFHPFQDARAYKSNEAAEKVIHSEIAVHAICTIMGVDYEDTPCLIVSNNLRFGQFCKFNTSRTKLEEQLLKLTDIAGYLSENPLQKSLKGLLHKFDERDNLLIDVESLEMNEISVGVISEILQSVSETNRKYEKGINNLRNIINRKYSLLPGSIDEEKLDDAFSLLNVYSKGNIIHEEKTNLFDESSFSLSPRMESIRGVNARSNTANPNPSPGFLLREWNNIQHTTWNYLSAAKLIMEHQQREFSYSNDYSVYTFPICKAFENETNLSVVQYMRRKMGVPMPAYFEKHYPGKDEIPVLPSAQIINAPRPIPLNKRSGGKWRPPGLGESQLVFATFRISDPCFGSDWLPAAKLTLLNEHWNQISKIRNITAHSDPVSEIQKNSLEMSLNTLQQNGILNSMTSLKYQLSPKH